METLVRALAVALLAYVAYWALVGGSAEFARAVKIVYYVVSLGEAVIMQHGLR